jgi:1-acyl-sn-glycerol-3-phosphate acyltransferase
MSSFSDFLAIGLIVAIPVALAIWFFRSWRRTGLTLPLFLLHSFNYGLLRFLWRVTIDRPLPVPAGSGAVIVANHTSSIDPLLIQLGTDRLVHWMVAREYVYHPAMAWAFRTLRSIPVGRRGVDTAATKLAIRLAQQGGLVGLFPEGRINDTSALLLPGRAGAALIALKANVPVVPCYVEGAPYAGTVLGPFFMPSRVRVHVGNPIDLAPFQTGDRDRAVLKEFTKRMMQEIAALAGEHSYEPRMAGKAWLSDGDEVEPASAAADGNGAEDANRKRAAGSLPVDGK